MKNIIQTAANVESIPLSIIITLKKELLFNNSEIINSLLKIDVSESRKIQTKIIIHKTKKVIEYVLYLYFKFIFMCIKLLII